MEIGTTPGTAYDGGKGSALEKELQTLKGDMISVGTEEGTAYDGAAGAALEQTVRELAGGSGTMYSVYIRNNMESLGFAAQYGEKCELDFSFISQYRDDISEPYKPTGELGICTVMIKNASIPILPSSGRWKFRPAFR